MDPTQQVRPAVVADDLADRFMPAIAGRRALHESLDRGSGVCCQQYVAVLGSGCCCGTLEVSHFPGVRYQLRHDHVAAAGEVDPRHRRSQGPGSFERVREVVPPASDERDELVDVEVEDTGMPVGERARYRGFPYAGGTV
jgi:hypothetical protein